MNNIYIACPSKVATGGPELLHQLCYKLNKFGYNAYMFYYGESDNPVHERYKIYNNKYVTELSDSRENIIIIPEINIAEMLLIKESKLIIWWLSVDNFLVHLNSFPYDEEYMFENINERKKENRIIHLVQSEYAKEYLIKNKIDSNEIYYLSDYLNNAFIKENQANKQNLVRYPNVLYNPKKGFDFTIKLIEASPELNWIKLENYSPREMSNIMKRSMIYIDFGNHPGKDRIPREAAISGCCIITGKRGAAANSVDIPINNEYKFEANDENIYSIIDKIKYIIKNYDSEINKFKHYRNMIFSEEDVFERDVEKIFQYILYNN
ncbi:hypothetical protein AAT22_13545 [Clostridium sp. C8]|nr:hypothetical protein AAT22_13545 [Clostridium sp. C8]